MKGVDMNRRTVFLAVLVCTSVIATALSVGCSGGVPTGGTGSSPGTTGPGSYGNSGGRMMGGSGNAPGNGGGPGNTPGSGNGGASGSFASDGERIFLSGVGVDGRNISRTAPRISQGSLMMGGGGCASCHAASGRGGTIRMMSGIAIKAPDVTYDALIKEGFTDASIRKAIREGLDETGKPLDAAMPRWQMSDSDLDATLNYLKQLSTR